MKGIAIAVETIVYLILAVTVMTVALMFFLSQGGKAQTDFEIEAARSSACASYQYYDPQCTNTDSAKIPKQIQKDLNTACAKYSERRNLELRCVSGAETIGDIKCVQQCCLACPQPKGKT